MKLPRCNLRKIFANLLGCCHCFRAVLLQQFFEITVFAVTQVKGVRFRQCYIVATSCHFISSHVNLLKKSPVSMRDFLFSVFLFFGRGKVQKFQPCNPFA